MTGDMSTRQSIPSFLEGILQSFRSTRFVIFSTGFHQDQEKPIIQDMLTIYTIPLSLYCAKLRILLRHKNLKWKEILPPGGYGSDEYKKIIPSGNLPTLIDGDLVLADSEAIAEYLNEKYPTPSMLPEDIALRAKVRERSRFHDTRLEPEVRKLFPFIDEVKGNNKIIGKQSEQISLRLNQFSRLFCNRNNTSHQLTLGECGFPITFAWIESLTPFLDLEIEWPDSIIQYKENLCQHKAVSDELASYRPCLNEWLESQSK